MENIILSMLNRYELVSDDDYANALKEIIQEIALLGLWRSKFFEHAAFYGGTALRILYHLDRFSEDLDFSLLKSNEAFDMSPYLVAIETELAAFGFTVESQQKIKTIDSAINSAFLKANTLEHLLKIDAPDEVKQRCHSRAVLKIKLEVDTDPPGDFNTKVIPLIRPIPFWVNTYSLPDLFAGKICAALTRKWKDRVKGRDWYDFLWFVQRDTPVNLKHLDARLRYHKFYQKQESLSPSLLKGMLVNRVNELDVEKAKLDISMFIKNQGALSGWSRDMFLEVVKHIKFI